MTDLAVKLLAGYLAEHYQRVKIMDYSTTYYDNCILVGDLNCNMFVQPNILTDFMDIFDLHNLFDEPTYHHKDGNSSIYMV